MNSLTRSAVADNAGHAVGQLLFLLIPSAIVDRMPAAIIKLGPVSPELPLNTNQLFSICHNERAVTSANEESIGSGKLIL